MPTNTTNLSLKKPIVGADEDAWGGYINDNFDDLDDYLSGNAAIPALTVGGNATLQSAEPKLILIDTDGPYTSTIAQSGTHMYIDNDSAGAIRMRTNGDKERLSISESGNINFFEDTGATVKLRWDASAESLGIGTTDTTLYNNTTGEGVLIEGGGTLQIANDAADCLRLNRMTSTGQIAYFYQAGVNVGNISVTGSSTSYNTSSDYRLKEDWQPMTGASDRVLALKPVNFAWKADGSRVDGFLAHELQEVVPEAATGFKDEVDEDLNPVYQGIDQSKLVPLLTAALQEALNKIDALETRIAALEG